VEQVQGITRGTNEKRHARTTRQAIPFKYQRSADDQRAGSWHPPRGLVPHALRVLTSGLTITKGGTPRDTQSRQSSRMRILVSGEADIGREIARLGGRRGMYLRLQGPIPKTYIAYPIGEVGACRGVTYSMTLHVWQSDRSP
jgi:hypothetical protein